MKKRPYVTPCADPIDFTSEGSFLGTSSNSLLFSNSYDAEGASAQYSRHRTDFLNDYEEGD